MIRSFQSAGLILAAIDYSDTAALVVAHALEAARETQSTELRFLHVRSGGGEGGELQGRCAELDAWLDGHLQGGRLLPGGVNVVAHVAGGDPAALIIEKARDLNAAMVIVGRRQNASASDAPLGSVAQAVVRSTNCPVLVVRRPPPPRSSTTPPAEAWAQP